MAALVYFANRNEFMTSYPNQRALAAAELPVGTKCIHDVDLHDWNGCYLCQMSGTVLLFGSTATR